MKRLLQCFRPAPRKNGLGQDKSFTWDVNCTFPTSRDPLRFGLFTNFLIWMTKNLIWINDFKKPNQFIALWERIIYSTSLSETTIFIQLGYIRRNFMLMISFRPLRREALTAHMSKTCLWKVIKLPVGPIMGLVCRWG